MTVKTILSISTCALLFAACGGNIEGEKIATDVSQTVGVVKVKTSLFSANKEKSVIHWIGKKPTKKHKGILSVSEGEFEVYDGNILAGKFVLDMTSIRNTDIEDASYRADLEKHLKSDDFFSVDQFPSGIFEITDVSLIIEKVPGSNASHRVSGNLTMRDTTNHIQFDARVSMTDSSLIMESDQFVIDRTQWKVMYNSGKLSDKIKDNLIKDEVGITVFVEATL